LNPATQYAPGHDRLQSPITVSELCCSFVREDGSELAVLDHITLGILPGEFVAIVGPSGCGKTTFLNIISGLLNASQRNCRITGEVGVGGLSPDEARKKRQFGVCFQRPTLFPWLDVFRNIELPLKLQGGSRKERIRPILELLAMVRLKKFAKANVTELSGGMQHRVALARSLALHPPVLVMDEPFAGTDEELREKLNFELLRVWSETKNTVLFVTHSLTEAILLASRVVVMSPRPARILRILPVNLPQRDRAAITSERFTKYLGLVRAAVRSEA